MKLSEIETLLTMADVWELGSPYSHAWHDAAKNLRTTVREFDIELEPAAMDVETLIEESEDGTIDVLFETL